MQKCDIFEKFKKKYFEQLMEKLTIVLQLEKPLSLLG